jgi:hypothetical protein
MTIDKAMLAQALRDADDAARAHTKGRTDDGGSCNFDTAYIQFPKGTRKAAIEAVSAEVGIRLYPHYYYKSAWFVDVHMPGQGNLRTEAAKAACESLRRSGLEAHMYYRVD